MRSRRAAFALSLALGAAALGLSPSTRAAPSPSPSQAQADRPVFRGGVELVQLDVSVLDAQRRPVYDLTASDFTIRENGVERPVRAFSLIRLPAASTAASSSPSAAPPDVVTNQIGDQEGRLVVILMDRSIPFGPATYDARKIALTAVDTLGPTDLAAVVSTSGGLPQNFTADRQRLTAAITQRDWSTGITPEQDAVASKAVGPDDPLSDGRCLCGVCVLDAVTRVAEALRHAPRRRKLLLFIGSHAIFQSGPRAPTADVGCGRHLRDARQRMLDAIALSSVTVHSIDPSGVVNVGGHTRASIPNAPGRPGASRAQQLQGDVMDHLARQDAIRVLPDLTGGRVVANTNAPHEDMSAIFSETASYYVLAFEPRARGAIDDMRRIEVKVARPGVKVHTQRRHRLDASSGPAVVPLAAGIAPTVDAALRGLLPVPTRRLALALSAFAGTGPRTGRVLVNVNVGAFAGEGDRALSLDFAVSAVDQTGRQVAFTREQATVLFPRGEAARSPEAVVQTHVDLAPGDYEIRVAVADPARNIVASVFAPIVVPSSDTAPLSFSDLVVETAGRSVAGKADAASPQPTTRRSFHPAERTRAVLQIYQGTGRDDAITPLAVRTRIVDAGGRVMREQTVDVAAESFVDRRVSLALDLDRLPRGSYELTVEASHARHAARRAVSFAVE